MTSLSWIRPPSLSLLTINVFAAASELLVPCQTHPYAYKALEDLFDTIDDIREEINPDIRVAGIVPTFFGPAHQNQPGYFGTAAI